MARLVKRHPELVRDTVFGITARLPVPVASLDTALRYAPDTPVAVETVDFTGFVTVSDSAVRLKLATRPDTLAFDTALTLPVIEVENTEKRGAGGLWFVLCLSSFLLVIVILKR